MSTMRLSRDQVRELCPSCADKMQLARITELKLQFDAEGELTFADENTARVYAGFSKGLCDRFAPDEGLFTRCAETMKGKVDDENAFCASLHKFCTGKWPAEKKYGVTQPTWDESAHPRAPAGSPEGGQFVPAKGTGTITIETEAYNPRRYSAEWVAHVDFTSNPKGDFRFGDRIGGRGEAGELTLTGLSPGDVVAYGQKDYRKNDSNMTWSYITKTGERVEVRDKISAVRGARETLKELASMGAKLSLYALSQKEIGQRLRALDEQLRLLESGKDDLAGAERQVDTYLEEQKKKEHNDDSDYQEYIDKREDVSPSAGKNRYGDVAFADAKNKKYPIDTEAHIRAAWNYINKGGNAAKYSPEDVKSIKAKIVAAWKAKIDKAGPPSAQQDHEQVDEFAVAGTKYMTREQVIKKCPDCARKMAGSGQDMPVDNGGHMNHICGKEGRAVEMSQEEAAAYSNSIKGVEIFNTGTHNGDEYTEQDLDDIVAAFKELDYRPAIKIGHTKEEDKTTAPAYGWVRNLRKVGTKLVADFEDMHDSVVEALRKRLYDRVSSEIYFNLRRAAKDGAEKVYRRALKAVALLGAEVPAVANLVPLHKMEFAADESAFDDLATCELQMDVPTQALVDSLAERVSGLVNLMKEYDMAKNTEQIAALKAKVDEFNKKMADMKKKKAMKDDEMMDDEEYAALAAEAQEISDRIAELEADDKDSTSSEEVAKLQERITASEAATKAAQDENKKLNERLTRIEQDRRNTEIGARVKACTIPAFRPALNALYAYALEHVTDVVKVYSEKDGKTVSEDKSLAEAVDAIVGEINSQSQKLFQALAFAGRTQREDGTVEEDPSREVDRRTKEYQRQHPEVKSYKLAMDTVLAADKELAQKYREQQGRGQ